MLRLSNVSFQRSLEVRSIAFLLCLQWLSTSSIWTQTPLEADRFTSSYFAESITVDELKDHLNVLTSSTFAGRETGTPGQEEAAQYLVSELKKMGVEKPDSLHNYWQNVVFTWVKWESLALVVNGQSYQHLRDFLCLQQENQNLPKYKVNNVLFMGYGIDDPRYSDYGRVKVAGKTIMILPGEPRDKDSLSLVTGTIQPSAWSTDPTLKLAIANQHKARLVLVVDQQLNKRIDTHRREVLSQKLYFGSPPSSGHSNVIYISPAIAQEIIGSREKTFVKNRHRIIHAGKGRPLHLPVKMEVQQHLTRNALYSKNVIGIIPGIDPNLSREVVVLSAHYDHLGIRGKSMYPGADDNASGTAAVLEIMEAIMEAKREGLGPKRSVMCIFFTGEEKGLLGSQYYSMHPVIPLEQTVVDVNIDMIGRADDKHIHQPHYIYVIGADRLSTELHRINEATNNAFSHLDLDYTYNAKDDPNRFYYRSDHYHFAKHGIPSIFYFSGVHADYHRPTDTVDKIMFKKYKSVVRHIFHTVWELAARANRLKVDVVDNTLYSR